MARLCSVDACDRLCVARGYCDAHYRRVLRGGAPKQDDPIGRGYTRGPSFVAGWAGCPRCGHEVRVPHCAICIEELDKQIGASLLRGIDDSRHDRVRPWEDLGVLADGRD
jgi:hypothetical protein